MKNFCDNGVLNIFSDILQKETFENKTSKREVFYFQTQVFSSEFSKTNENARIWPDMSKISF